MKYQEVSLKDYDYFMCVLPPIWLHKSIVQNIIKTEEDLSVKILNTVRGSFAVDEPVNHTAEGKPVYDVYFIMDKKCYKLTKPITIN